MKTSGAKGVYVPSDRITIHREIGACIRAARLALKMTQHEIASRVGIDTSFYGQIERGTNVLSLPTLFAIARVLRIEPALLLPPLKGHSRPELTAIQALRASVDGLAARKRRAIMGAARCIAALLR